MSTQEELNRLATTLLFDGSSTKVVVPDSNNLSVTTTGSITISAWIRPDTLLFPNAVSAGVEGTYVHWLQKGEYSTPLQEWAFRMYSNDGNRPNRISFYVFNSSGGVGVGSYFQDTIVAGEWIHVVGKIDSSKTYIYKNGVLRDSDVYTASITPTNTSAQLGIGAPAIQDVTPMFFLGAIRDVIIFNRALSNSEVTNLYNGSIPPGVVARYMLNDRASTATDISNSNNGTITNANWSANNLSVNECLNVLAHKNPPILDSTTAANIWANTSNLRLQDALNAKAGTVNLRKQEAVKIITTL